MNPFASEPSQAAQEEVEHVHTAPDRPETETLGSSVPGEGALPRDPAEWVSGDDPTNPAQPGPEG